MPRVSGDMTRHGVVKSWNGSKGFGFIVADGFAGDVMFARAELAEDHREVRGKFLEGKSVSFQPTNGPDGRLKAMGVQVIAAEGAQLAGVIKTYSEMHGYGFISSSSLTDDVHFFSNDISGLIPGTKLQGELVIFEMAAGHDEGQLRASMVMFQSAKIAERLGSTGVGKGAWGSGHQAHGDQAVAADMLATMGGMGIPAAWATDWGKGADMPATLGGTGIPAAWAQLGSIGGGQGADMMATVDGMGIPAAWAKGIGASAALGSGDIPAAWAQGIGAVAALGNNAKGSGKGSRNPVMQNPVVSALISMGEDDSVTMNSNMEAASMILGCVKSFSEQNGYGFLNVPGQPADLKFGKGDLQCETVNKGDMVHFSIEKGRDGRLQAKMITPQAGGTQRQKRPAPAAAAFDDVGAAEETTQRQKRPAPAAPGAALGMAAKKHKTESSTGQQMQGSIKSYNSSKGFGFINAEGVGGDVFFMMTALPQGVRDTHGRDMIGQTVTFEVMQATDGQMRAGNITFVETQATDGTDGQMHAGTHGQMRASNTETSTGQQMQGSIKSYNSSKGFGFINAEGLDGDVFFMRSSLPEELQEMDGRGMTGQSVLFEVMHASDFQLRAGNIIMDEF